MALIDHVNWASLDRLVLNQQRNRSAHAPVISLFRWWARRPHCFAGAVLDAAKLEFDSTSFLVADPFSGGGTVAFEAVGRGLPVYAQDLYPWPSQGLAIALTSASAVEFENAARSFLEQLRPYREAYWRAEGGQIWETTHVIRVRTSHCVECGKQLFLFLVCTAYWIVASRYHTGQASRGYAKLSQLARMGYASGLASWEKERGSEERAAAARLLASRRQEIRLHW
jgi:hypothetical protein